MARFMDYLDDHRDDENQRAVIRRVAEYCDEWEEMAGCLPDEMQAEDALNMFQGCIGMRTGPTGGFDGFDHLAERCSELFIERARRLTRQERELFAYRVAKMFQGHFGSSMFERMLMELIDPTNVGHVLDIIRTDLYYRYKDSDDLIIDIIDEDYREFAKRLIAGVGRSCRGKLKDKLTIKMHG